MTRAGRGPGLAPASITARQSQGRLGTGRPTAGRFTHPGHQGMRPAWGVLGHPLARLPQAAVLARGVGKGLLLGPQTLGSDL